MSSSFKVVLLGEGRVGKTSLCLRYVEGEFDSKQQSTIQATYLDKTFHLGKRQVKLMIWDTAGQERFHALGPIYYRDANGALLVYDITDRDSFTKVRNWVKELRKIVGDDICLVIAGNKSDLEKRRQVDENEAKAYAKDVGAKHIYTSAKSGKGVDEAFLTMTKDLLAFEKTKTGGGSSGGRRGTSSGRGSRNMGRKKNFVQIVDSVEKEKTGTCCGS